MSGTYPNNWDQIATAIKELAGWRCERCGHPHDPKGEIPCDDLCDMNYKHPKGKRRGLTVHHLDGDKSNCAAWNLAALCQACHLQIQVKIKLDQMWMGEHSKWFIPHLFGYLQTVSQESVEQAINSIAQGGNFNLMWHLIYDMENVLKHWRDGDISDGLYRHTSCTIDKLKKDTGYGTK